jgi:hypothetical protein
MDAKRKTFIEALHSNFGNITKACQSCDISRQTYYDWIDKDEGFKFHVKNIEEYIIDTVESDLHKQIKEGNTVATIFYLKTKAKHRGYVERQESRQVDKDNNDVEYKVTLNLS